MRQVEIIKPRGGQLPCFIDFSIVGANSKNGWKIVDIIRIGNGRALIMDNRIRSSCYPIALGTPDAA